MAENNQPNENEELNQFRREDIKTMDKDIFSAREEEARIERERVIQMNRMKSKQGFNDIIPKPSENIKKQTFEPLEKKTEGLEEIEKTELIPRSEPKEEIEKPEPVKKELIRKPRKRNSFKKIFVRGLVIIVTIGLAFAMTQLPWDKMASFLYPEEKEYQPEVEPEIENEPVIEFTIPSPLFPIQNTVVADINNKEEILDVLSDTLSQNFVENSLNQIVFKYVPENRELSLEEIPLIAIFGAEVLPEIYQHLSLNYTLVAYPQSQGSRFAFVTKVQDNQGLIDLFKVWESQIIQSNIVINQENIQPLNNSFKTKIYNEVGLRYLTLSTNDLGICYAYFDDYFMISSSLEIFEQVIDSIQSVKVDQNI
jgi:hypothetical protein